MAESQLIRPWEIAGVAGSGGKRGTQKWNRDEAKDAAAADRKAARAKSLEVFQSHRQRAFDAIFGAKKRGKMVVKKWEHEQHRYCADANLNSYLR